MAERSSLLAPFRHETFRLLWLATLVSNLGGLVQSVGAGWMMTTLTDSHNMVALVQASTTLPIMVFSLAAGALADNFDRRRIRRRDGARQWALLRDLEQPDLWVESYHVPTWIDYVRHNMRRTKADADNVEQLRALHRGPDLPKAHRMIERQTVPLNDDTPLRNSPEV